MKERCDRKWPQRSFRCFREEFGGGNTLEYAVDEKLILVNPAKKCKIPKNTRKEMNILPEALIGPYLSAAKEHGILAPMYLELTTGLTVREIAAALGMSKSAVQRRIDHIGNRVRLLASA